MVRAKIDVRRLASILILHGYSYITVYQLASLLGISTRAAGRLLAAMGREGLAERRSKRTYKLLFNAFTLVKATCQNQQNSYSLQQNIIHSTNYGLN